MRGEFSYHGGPTNRAPIPACASATLLYAYRIIKPGSQALSTIQKPPLIATINRDKGFGFWAELRSNCLSARRVFMARVPVAFERGKSAIDPLRLPRRLRASGFSSWPGFVPGIHVFLAYVQSRRGCPAQGRA